MKSALIWIMAVSIGAGLGYVAHLLLGLNIWLLVASGGVVGSSVGITINIYNDEDEFDIEIPRGPSE